MKRSFLYLSLLLLVPSLSYGQCAVAITIDDVPNTLLYRADNGRTMLLDRIDSLMVPVTIFINEKLLYATDEAEVNMASLARWAGSRNVALGTHTYSHLWYSETDYEKFRDDYRKGMAITSGLAAKYGKPLKYFRFPYNDLGTDSAQHAAAAKMVSEENNILAPFTVSSSDYAFSALYKYYLLSGDQEKAQAVAGRYISTTIEYFEYMDSLSLSMYGRHMSQVYLCHDNILNAACLPLLVDSLKERGYTFITLDEALSDPAYQQEDLFYNKWGISWFYRWMKDPEERKSLMRREPDMLDIEKAFENIENYGHPGAE